MITLKRILVPHDFSSTSDAAMKYAVELARTFGARLHLLHVDDKVEADIAMEFPLGLDGSMEDAIRERLLKIVTPAELRTLKPEFEVRAGTPANEIVAYARLHQVDVIVMGTHGRGFVAHAVLGSVAEKVVRSAPCPVLTIRHADRPAFVADAVSEVAQNVAL